MKRNTLLCLIVCISYLHSVIGREIEELPASKPQGFKVTTHLVAMHDLKQLTTLVYKKNTAADEKLPVILLRTPYFNSHGRFKKAFYDALATYFIDRQYHFVLQSIRGRCGSEGTYRLSSP